MSHDITFYRKKRVLYLPKYYFITVHFRKYLGWHDGNVFNLERSDLCGLLDQCRKVSENHELAQELLPLDKYYMNRYDDVYFDKVRQTAEYIENVLLPLFDTLEKGERIEFELSN